MSDVLVVSCRLCLQPDESTSMVAIIVPLIPAVSSAELSICRSCARRIVAAVEKLDAEDNQEVPNNDATRAPDGAASGDSAAAPEADPPVVLQGQPGPEASTVDRSEPKVPAGGEASCLRCKRPLPAEDLLEWVGSDSILITVCKDCEIALEKEMGAASR